MEPIYQKPMDIEARSMAIIEEHLTGVTLPDTRLERMTINSDPSQRSHSFLVRSCIGLCIRDLLCLFIIYIVSYFVLKISPDPILFLPV